MKEVSLVFPHHLFDNHPAIQSGRPVYLIEEHLFFRQYPFHKLKIRYHRASMRKYQTLLLSVGHQVHYIESHEPESDLRQLLLRLKEQGVQVVHCCEMSDDWLNKRMIKTCGLLGINKVIHRSPMFLCGASEIELYLSEKKRYFQTDFYIWQRKRLGVLLDHSSKPLGGKWSYDADNRKRLPKGIALPELRFEPPDQAWAEAGQYVKTHFSNNPGEDESLTVYPTDHLSARQFLKQFLEQRLEQFGDYEDAISKKESFLYHSALTPVLNTGLLTPLEVLTETLNHHSRFPNLPLNSLEGFIRQIIGWREFIRMVYATRGSHERTRNHWEFKRKIPTVFYTGETGIVPLDICFSRMQSTAYNHHIERLMVFGNFFLLCEFDPDDVYQWFMIHYIDAYDWVMVPNVYGMSQFADGGLFATKPYISGSNYLMKMSDFQEGPWQETWDALFWRFIHVHRTFFLSNPRLSMMVRTFDKMNKEKQEQHLLKAESYLQKLDTMGPWIKK